MAANAEWTSLEASGSDSAWQNSAWQNGAWQNNAWQNDSAAHTGNTGVPPGCPCGTECGAYGRLAEQRLAELSAAHTGNTGVPLRSPRHHRRTVEELTGSVEQLKGSVTELKSSVDALKGSVTELCGLLGHVLGPLGPMGQPNGSRNPPHRSHAGTPPRTPPPRSHAGTPLTTPPRSPGMVAPTCCRHSACNIPADGSSSLANVYVCNGIVIKDLEDLGPWTSHLVSTLFSKHYDLWQTLFTHLSTHFCNYKITYCTAKANRFFHIECHVCGCAVFGTYSYEKDEAITALACFLDVALTPGEIQV